MGLSSNIYSIYDSPGKKKTVGKVLDIILDDEDYEGKVSGFNFQSNYIQVLSYLTGPIHLTYISLSGPQHVPGLGTLA